jgi:hypothetical protein
MLCRAVLCRAVPCRAVLCRAVLPFRPDAALADLDDDMLEDMVASYHFGGGREAQDGDDDAAAAGGRVRSKKEVCGVVSRGGDLVGETWWLDEGYWAWRLVAGGVKQLGCGHEDAAARIMFGVGWT